MTERYERNAAIIRQLELQANAAAVQYAEEVAEYQRLYRLERMQDVVFDIADWIEEVGDEVRLAELGVDVIEDDGIVKLKQGARSFELRARDDMTIVVGGKIMHPNNELPVLDPPFYAEVMNRVFAWARQDSETKPRRYFE